MQSCRGQCVRHQIRTLVESIESFRGAAAVFATAINLQTEDSSGGTGRYNGPTLQSIAPAPRAPRQEVPGKPARPGKTAPGA